MKKFISYLTLLLCAVHLSGCSADKEAEEDSTAVSSSEAAAQAQELPVNAPEITQIRSICELATLECYYNNVAKAVKPKGSGFMHWGEIDRTFWIEYKGMAKIGVDMSDVTMVVENGVYVITIPKAEILSINIDPASLNEESYIFSEDSWNPNYITADDQTNAIEAAQNNMRETVLNNSTLLVNAQNRAKTLIENYIHQLETASGTDFEIRWNYEENEPATEEEPSEVQEVSETGV